MPIAAAQRPVQRQNQNFRLSNTVIAFLAIIAGIFAWNSSWVQLPSSRDNCTLFIKHVDRRNKQINAVGEPCRSKGQTETIARYIMSEVRKIDGQLCSTQCLKRDNDGEWVGFITTGPLGQELKSIHCGHSDQLGCGRDAHEALGNQEPVVEVVEMRWKV